MGSSVSAARRFAVTLPTLLVAHNVADHLVQTDHQAANKATRWRAMAGHVGGYLATAEAALLLVGAVTGEHPTWRRRLLGHLVSGATHAIVDRRWPVVEILERTGSPAFAAPRTRVYLDVNGYGQVQSAGIPRTVELRGPVPLHGPYLADQALHHGCLLIAALVMAGGKR